LGKRVEPGRLHRADAIDETRAGGAHRDGDPFALVGAVGLADGIPAAVLAAEVVGEVADVDQLVGVLVRVLVGADDNVRPAADVRGHRRLGTHVFPAFGIDAYLDAARFRELLRVRRPGILIALDEALPAQHAQLRAFFGRDLVLLRLRLGGEERRSGTERSACGYAGGGFQKIATLEMAHASSSVVFSNRLLSC